MKQTIEIDVDELSGLLSAVIVGASGIILALGNPDVPMAFKRTEKVMDHLHELKLLVCSAIGKEEEE